MIDTLHRKVRVDQRLVHDAIALRTQGRTQEEIAIELGVAQGGQLAEVEVIEGVVQAPIAVGLQARYDPLPSTGVLYRTFAVQFLRKSLARVLLLATSASLT